MQKFIAKNLRIILYSAFLLVIYIGLRYKVEGTVSDIFALSKEVSELQKRYMQVKTDYQRTTQMTYINARLESIGVGIPKEPIKDIIVYDEPKIEEDKQ